MADRSVVCARVSIGKDLALRTRDHGAVLEWILEHGVHQDRCAVELDQRAELRHLEHLVEVAGAHGIG